MKTIGIFGVSGVGKTSLTSEIIRQEPTWQRVSGGSLIQDCLRNEPDRDSLRTMPRSRILENQNAIVRGLSSVRSSGKSEVILFDGHLLIDSGSDLIEIPLEVIRRLYLNAIVFLYDEANEIMRRRQSDPRRKRAGRSRKAIDQEQSRTYAIAERAAQILGIPFLVVTPKQQKEVRDAIRKWLNIRRLG